MEQERVEILLSPQEGMTGVYDLRILIRAGGKKYALTGPCDAMEFSERGENTTIPVIAEIGKDFQGSDMLDLLKNTEIRVMRTVYEQYNPEVEIEEAS